MDLRHDPKLEVAVGLLGPIGRDCLTDQVFLGGVRKPVRQGFCETSALQCRFEAPQGVVGLSSFVVGEKSGMSRSM